MAPRSWRTPDPAQSAGSSPVQRQGTTPSGVAPVGDAVPASRAVVGSGIAVSPSSLASDASSVRANAALSPTSVEVGGKGALVIRRVLRAPSTAAAPSAVSGAGVILAYLRVLCPIVLAFGPPPSASRVGSATPYQTGVVVDRSCVPSRRERRPDSAP